MRAHFLTALAIFAMSGASVVSAQALDEKLRDAAADYRERLTTATEELNKARDRVAAGKAPLLEQMRAAQDRALAAESEARRLETGSETFTEQRRKKLLELDDLRKSARYASTLAHDSLKAAVEGFAPGEDQFAGGEAAALLERLKAATPEYDSTLDAVEFLLARTEILLGGYRAEGKAVTGATNEVVSGTFAYVGPEAFFMPAQQGAPGSVRSHEGARFPTIYPIAGWRPEEAAQFFAGKPGMILADASSGKALKLKETTGTVWTHIRKGGVVSFAILGVGILAAVMILQKVRDLRRLEVESPGNVETFLDLVAKGAIPEAKAMVPALKASTREIFETGLLNVNQPANLLEERLQAVLLDQRILYERRLPLLAVIATAAPLMGLLGTVVGMVKTFALITVFGTGNASRLSSGISEVLVATELGLAVAIPTLVAHGFLAHRIQRRLSVLERQALQFTTAAGIARAAPGYGAREVPVPA